ncbi:hypothetical protein ElyMa_000372200 [Elysia marginata]|uniref:Uncharacterized protein n=1 Tax=Elysia marginata TaxID=1093978 RepID=A0AAV4FHK1_9GAST|nr:hypothetical protein ElyMa_000372200 [Elysia marginata]
MEVGEMFLLYIQCLVNEYIDPLRFVNRSRREEARRSRRPRLDHNAAPVPTHQQYSGCSTGENIRLPQPGVDHHAAPSPTRQASLGSYPEAIKRRPTFINSFVQYQDEYVPLKQIGKGRHMKTRLRLWFRCLLRRLMSVLIHLVLQYKDKPNQGTT